MPFPVMIKFLVLCLWVSICLPVGFLYSEGRLGNVYDIVILSSLCASIVITFIVVVIVVFVYYGV